LPVRSRHGRAKTLICASRFAAIATIMTFLIGMQSNGREAGLHMGVPKQPIENAFGILPRVCLVRLWIYSASL